MSFLKQLFISSIGKKLVMALTGLFLIGFLIIHVSLNACVFATLIWQDDRGEMFNKAAAFMGSNVVPRILEIGLFLGLLAHIVQGLMLTFENRSKRTIGYKVPYTKGSKWYSRSMGLLGTLLLLFLILHLYNFWIPSRLGGKVGDIHHLQEVIYNGRSYHNLFIEMQIVFQSGLIVVIYVLGCIALAYHLLHGFLSAFKTMGVLNKNYLALIHCLGLMFSIIVPLVFALMPISFYFGWVHG
ncbi:MAG: succinate dehydrogenase cytochrome b subunit [Phycisphaerales bacterium]|nr:succinate dehydrogenase cytochrome b subunit [Phycisphaerales bacterium]